MRRLITIAVLIIGALSAPGTAHADSTKEPAAPAQDGVDDALEGEKKSETSEEPAQPKQSAAEIAAELANPNTVLGVLSFNFDYVSYESDLPGADDPSAFRLTFQPVLPYPLGEGLNLFARPAVPVVFTQDVPAAGGGFEGVGVDLADIGFDVALGKSFKSGVVLIGGMVGTVPTATKEALGKDQLALGPEGLFGWVHKRAVVGVLVTHQWSVAGHDAVNTNLTGGQYFYTINVKNGWQIRSGPTFSYDHEVPSGQRWTFPVGIGVNKTSILKGGPWKFGLEYWHYLAQPDAYGPGWQLRVTVAPVVPLPW